MKRKDTRETILLTALSLYSKHGCENVPQRELAFETSLPEETIHAYFPDKDAIIQAIVEYIPTVLVHYAPTRADIEQLLLVESPRQILSRFVTYYSLKNEQLWQTIYRFAFMEQYNYPAVRELAYSYIFGPPREYAAQAMDILAEHGAIPPCNSQLISQLWGRTSYIYLIRRNFDGAKSSAEEYWEMTQFFIDMAVRGIELLPVQCPTLSEPLVLFPPLSADQTPTLDQRILCQALDLFHTFGYRRVTMQQIGDALELSLPELYRCYRSKEAILSALLSLHKSRCTPQQKAVFDSALVNRDPVKVIELLTQGYAGGYDKLTTQLYHVMFSELFLSQDLGDYFLSSLFREVETTTKALDDLSAVGRLPHDSPNRQLATAFIHALYAFAMESIAKPSTERYHSCFDVIRLLTSVAYNGFSS